MRWQSLQASGRIECCREIREQCWDASGKLTAFPLFNEHLRHEILMILKPFLPEIRTKRLQLAQLQLSDVSAIYNLARHETIAGVVHYLSRPFSVEKAHDLIASAAERDEVFIGVRRSTDGHLVGVVGVHHLSQPELEISYWVGYEFRQQGFATEAVTHVIGAIHGVTQSQISAECRRENLISWELLKKLGFLPTGIPGKRPGRQLLRYKSHRV
jgi:aminoglycoside 6'-N-acetyltransferase